MKNYFISLRLACMMLVSLLAVSCGSKKDYRDALPANAFITISVNPASLEAKSNHGNIEQNPLFINIKEALNNAEELSAEQKEFILSLIKDPAQSGIDQNSEIYLFGNIDQMQPEGGILAKINDQKKFDELIAFLSESTGLQPEQEGDLKVISPEKSEKGTVLLAYNEGMCMLFAAQYNYKKTLTRVQELVDQDKKASLLADKNAAALFNEKNDINMGMLYKNMPVTGTPLTNSPMLQAMEQCAVLISTNFEKGKIVTECKVSGDSEAMKQLETLYGYARLQSGALLPYLPADAICTIGVGLKGEKLYELFANEPQLKDFAALPQFKEIVNALDGDLAIEFSGMEKGKGLIPIFSLLTEVNDPEILNYLFGQITLMGITPTKTGDQQYQIDVLGFPIYAGMKGKILYVTTNPKVHAALSGEKIESMEANAKLFKKQQSSMLLNFKGVSQLLNSLYGSSPSARYALMFIDIFDTMEASGNTNNNSIITINMVDQNKNALETICSTVETLVRLALPAMM